MGIAHLILQQPVALAHRLVIGEHGLAMLGQKAQRHPVQKSPPPLGRLDPQPVHRGHQPQYAQHPPQHGLRRRLAIDPHHARIQPLGKAHHLMRRVQAVHLGRNLPANRLGPPRQVLRRCPPQPATGRQQRHRLQNIGLSRAVRAMNGHRPPVKGQPRQAVAAELRQHQGCDRKASQTLPLSSVHKYPTGVRGCETPGPTPITRASASRHRSRWCHCLRASGSDRPRN